MTHSSAPLAAVPGLAGVASSRVTRHRPLQRYEFGSTCDCAPERQRAGNLMAAGDIRDIGVDNLEAAQCDGL